MKLHEFDTLAEYQPKGHEGFASRRLASRAMGADGSVRVSHATVQPGGHSDIHRHETSIQIYIGLSGTLIAGNGVGEYPLAPLSAAIFEKGTDHFVENRSDEVATVLVITAPEPKRR
ncbi:MAG: cupin domain-containing protein [Acidimicrobiia bacterium]